MWIYQAVTNVGVQVLVLIGIGYLFARFKFLEQAKFLPQSNFIVLMLALPAFNLYLMGIKLDLQNPEPWKSLAAFLLWVFVVQACILAYTWRFCGGDAGEAAVVNMVLLMDNYAITGLLALNATLGTKWGTLALLMAMGFFLVIFPFSLAAFEWEKWAVQQHVEAIAEAAAVDIEAAAAAAAEAEVADGVKQPPEASGSSNQPTGVPPPQGVPRKLGDGIDLDGRVPKVSDDVELSMCPAADQIRPHREPPPDGSKSSANGGDGDGALVPMLSRDVQGGESQRDVSGFPHESRYCWWSNADYRPARPLLGGEVVQTSQPLQGTAPRQQWQRRRREGLLSEQLRQQQQQQQLRTGAYVPPLLLPAPPADSTSPNGSSLPLVSPFQASAAAAWTNDVAVGTASETGPQSQPATAPSSAARRPVAVGSMPSQTQSPRRGLAEHRGGSLLASMFERLAAAGSGQLPPSMFGDLGRTGAGGPLPDPERPKLQNLEFALTHQLSGGTASQLARISRGYAAAAAAATAAAASPDANLRRMLLGAAGAGGRSPRQMALAVSRQGSEPVGPAHLAATAGPAVGTGTPGRAPGGMPRTGIMQPPPSASTGTGGIGGLGPLWLSQQHKGGGAGTMGPSAAPTTLASLKSGDSIGPSLGPPAMTESADIDAAMAAAKYSELACPTFSHQAATSAAAPWHVASAQVRPPAAEGRLSSTSTPMFSFGRQSQQQRPAAATGSGDSAAGASEFPLRRGAVERSASDTGQVDKMLLKLASGLALDTAMRRTASGRGDRSPLLADTDPNVLVQLASAVAVPDSGDMSASVAADKELVREATREALRRHGGLARAFAAFVSGHPQLWHIVSTLGRNPMIWTMFVAMTVSVSGLRVFLDPASPSYRPEVGWIAGSLSWINGLVVPISIFSNGAWMYGKPLLPKGEVVKVLVLLLIKVGALPLLMAGCALLVRLDGQHVAAMTVLTLSPAAAASFVLAVQYGRGVELVSLTNILGNIFLTPLLIMWLKILGVLRINFHLHDDV